MPDSKLDILRVAFNLPPEKAIEYLRRKGYTISWDWQDTLAAAHEKAFTVAKVTRMDVLVSIRQMVDRAITEGITFDKFQRSLEPYLKLAGWWGRTWPRNENGELLDENGKPFQLDASGEPIIPENMVPPLLGSPSRLETIFDTNVQVAYSAGRYVGMMEAVKQRPYWQYIAVRDPRTTQLCASLNTLVFRSDDPFWDRFYPPNHWRCRSGVRSLSKDDLTRLKLEVQSAKGKMASEEVLLSKRTGEVGEATSITIAGQTYRNDPAFNYHPGKTAFAPDLAKYPKDLQRQYKKDKKP